MKNVKIEKQLTGPEWWKSTFAVEVKGDPNAADLPPGLSREEKKRVIQSWRTVAVLEIKPNGAPRYVGFISGTYLGVLKYPLETLDGKFGMRIGRGDVQFFAFDPNFENEIKLTLIEITKEGDPKYRDLLLY